MKTNQEILDRINNNIEALQENLVKLQNENVSAEGGMMSIQKIVDVEKIKSEIKALKEIKSYIK